MTCSSGDNVLNLLLDRPKKIGESSTSESAATCLYTLYKLQRAHSYCFSYWPNTVAIDISYAQSSLLEIKLAAIKHLHYGDYLCLLGEKDKDTAHTRC